MDSFNSFELLFENDRKETNSALTMPKQGTEGFKRKGTKRIIKVQPTETINLQTSRVEKKHANKRNKSTDQAMSKRNQMLLVSQNTVSEIMPQLFRSSSIFYVFWFLAYTLFFVVLVLQTAITIED